MSTAVKLLLTDREKFKSTLEYKIHRHKRRNIIPQDQRTVSRTLEEALQIIRDKKYTRILICGDSTFRGLVPESSWDWASIQSKDLNKAITLTSANLQNYDAILVGGKDVRTSYVHILKYLKQQNIVKPVIWVGQDFEFGGSTVPLIQELKDADIYLFNHYGDFFQVKDPLLVHGILRDEVSTVEKYFILEPNESLRVNLREWLPKQKGNAVFEVYTNHPTLTRKRHRRWRLWADLFWKDSFASLHGAHDYGPSELNSAFMSADLIEHGKVVVTMANYALDMKPEETEVTRVDEQKLSTVKRDPKLLVDTLEFSPITRGNKPHYVGFRYWGYGDNFWHFFEEKGFEGSSHPVLLSNHNSTQPIQLRTDVQKLTETLAWVKKMHLDGFMIYPHAIPVMPENSELEFGFTFEWANLPVNHFTAHVFNAMGEKIGGFPFVKEKLGHLFTSEILKDFSRKSEANLVVIEPDVEATKDNPMNLYMAGDLAVRNKKTQDRDLTEFQSCWRNIGALFPDFPHWIHPSKAVIGRSNLVGRILNRDGFKTGIVLVNGSGNLNYKTNARCLIEIFSPEGETLRKEVRLPAFGSKVIWAHELFPNLSEVLTQGFGSCTISSLDADFNAQIITTSSAGSVSLQHLWGY